MANPDTSAPKICYHPHPDVGAESSLSLSNTSDTLSTSRQEAAKVVEVQNAVHSRNPQRHKWLSSMLCFRCPTATLLRRRTCPVSLLPTMSHDRLVQSSSALLRPSRFVGLSPTMATLRHETNMLHNLKYPCIFRGDGSVKLTGEQ